MNITLSVDDDLLKKARKIAIDRDTTLPKILRQYIAELVEYEERDKQSRLQQVTALFDEAATDLNYSQRDWTRDELHER